jgi:pyruvate kinase
MIRARRARIVATLGPASRDPSRVRELATAGADVFRVNFSHGSQAEHARTIQAVRRAEAAVGRPLAVLADLQGPKLRLGEFADGVVRIRPGQNFRLDMRQEPGDASRVRVPHPEVFVCLKTGAHVLLDDGKIRLRVLDHGPDFADTEVEAGEQLSDHKGLNLPNLAVPIPALTEKDRRGWTGWRSPSCSGLPTWPSSGASCRAGPRSSPRSRSRRRSMRSTRSSTSARRS